MRIIAHIINPVVVNEESDLFIAQPVTFATMTAARDFARGKVDVFLFTAQYPEDRPLVPADFQATPDLERSVLDLASFKRKRKLPFIKDILDRLYEAAPEAEYLIYTNVDIALKPEFYVAVNTFIEEGHDGFVINRRTIRDYKSIEEIPLMYADPGESHPGWDCFVFKRESYPRFILGDICVGANLIGTVLLFNLLCTSKHFMEFKNEHLTFHLGDDRVWKSDNYSDYADHNLWQTEKIISELKSIYGSIDGDGRYSYLITHVYSLGKKVEGTSGLVKAVEVNNKASALNPSLVHLQNKIAEPAEKARYVGSDSNQKVICITGMGRSGSSMVARILNIMGLYLGPEENLILQTDYNVTGCWEHKTLLEISDTIIKTVGYHEFQQPDWVTSRVIAGLEDKAGSIIKRDFKGVQLWGWKDDRCSLTLPFWQRILPDMEYVICIRNPVDVAKSLVKKKWAASDEQGMYRWLIFIASAIANTHGRRRIFVMYEDFLSEQWKTAVKGLAEFLGPEYAARIPEYEKEITKFIIRDLQHYSTSISDMLNNAEIPYVVKHFYVMLHNYVKGKSTCCFDEEDTDKDHIINAAASYAKVDALRMKHRYLSVTNNKQIKSGLMREQDTKIDQLSDLLAQRDRRIEELLNSYSWKITKPLRWAYDSLTHAKKTGRQG